MYLEALTADFDVIDHPALVGIPLSVPEEATLEPSVLSDDDRIVLFEIPLSFTVGSPILALPSKVSFIIGGHDRIGFGCLTELRDREGSPELDGAVHPMVRF